MAFPFFFGPFPFSFPFLFKDFRVMDCYGVEMVAGRAEAGW